MAGRLLHPGPAPLVHPTLYRFDVDHLAPEWRSGSVVVHEVAEDIYVFPLFSSTYCRMLIEEAEACGRWMNEPSLETFPPLFDRDGRAAQLLPRALCPPHLVEDGREPDQALPLALLPGLDAVFLDVALGYLEPLLRQVWPDLTVSVFDHPYVLRYRADLCRSMELHEDEETIALIAYLNEDFEGGGTYFPRFGVSTGREPPGWAVVYPGGATHLHEGLPITSGVRYLLLASFF